MLHTAYFIITTMGKHYFQFVQPNECIIMEIEEVGRGGGVEGGFPIL
jgi:hypothetical protein